MSIPFSSLKDLLIAPRSLSDIAQAVTDGIEGIPEFISLPAVLELAPVGMEEKWLKALDAKGFLSDLAAPEKPVEYDRKMDKADLLVDWKRLCNYIGNPEFMEAPMQPRPRTR